jgi:hypothetical protein
MRARVTAVVDAGAERGEAGNPHGRSTPSRERPALANALAQMLSKFRAARDPPNERVSTSREPFRLMGDLSICNARGAFADESARRRHTASRNDPCESSGVAFRLQANMRRGTGSAVRVTWQTYSTVQDARKAAREAFSDDRVVRMTVVTDTVPPRFVEWIGR